MKWPIVLALIRHCQSEFNALRPQKEKDPDYQHFVQLFEQNPGSEVVRDLAEMLWEKYQLQAGDWDTKATADGLVQAQTMAWFLHNKVGCPDAVVVSPYDRTMATLEAMYESWPKLKQVKTIEDHRLREQSHGLQIVYNDWRIFQALHPEQKLLYDREGPYWYKYPQGENVPDVIERIRSFIGTLVRDYSEKKVIMVTHHITILATMAALGRWDAAEYIRWDTEQKPINCGVTIYRGNSEIGDNGKLELADYNLKLY